MKQTIIAIAALSLFAGCTQAEQAANKVADTAADTTNSAAVAVKDAMPGVNIADAPAGTYESEDGHAYITFQYMHQGYSRPTLRWNDFDAIVNLNTDNPEASTLNVTINAASVDSGVAKFDDHMRGSDMFDVEKFPTITFTSTDIDQGLMGSGTLTGDLTMKGITKPITLKAKLNKVGESRSKKPMFGISATTSLKRSDWDVGYAVPYVGDDVDIMIEVEFQKAE